MSLIFNTGKNVDSSHTLNGIKSYVFLRTKEDSPKHKQTQNSEKQKENNKDYISPCSASQKVLLPAEIMDE